MKPDASRTISARNPSAPRAIAGLVPLIVPALGLLTLALLIPSISGPTATAADIQPPPPSIDETQITIPKPLRRLYSVHLHPEYVRWLGSSDGTADTVGSFSIFLTTQPLSHLDRQYLVLLYLECH